MTEIIVKKGVGEPPAGQVAEGELALDVQDGVLYSKLRDGAIHALNQTTNADNYQYWQYKIDGFSTTNVMSTQVLDFQSGNGIEITKEGFGIKISATATGGGGGSLWEQNGSDIYYSSGNVGIGTDSPNNLLVLSDGGNDGVEFGVNNNTYGNFMLSYTRASGTSSYTPMAYRASAHNWFLAGTNQGMALTGSGNLGIGTDSPNKRLEVARLGTAETITDLDGNTGLVVSKGGGTASSGACAAFVGGDQTTITGITMGGLTDPRQSRILHSNIDDSLNFHTGNNATPRLTIDASGEATFSGTVNAGTLRANNVWGSTTTTGIRFATSAVVPTINGSTGSSNNSVNLGIAANSWKDGWFGGTVNAGSAYIKQGSVGNRGGAQFGSANGFLQLNNTFTHFEPSTDAVVELGSTATRFKNAFFSGTVNAGAFVGDGSGLTNLPSSGPTYTAGNGISISSNQIAMKGSYTGNFSATGTITGTDCIATSDERLKDNITTAPVGLIDHLKGREWDWLETREKGSGVVAQELEKVLPHLVHEDDEGMKSVSYNGLVAYLIEEVKALKAEVETLRNG